MNTVDWELSSSVQVGDVVSADAGGMPVYRVLAVEDGEALLEDERHAVLKRAPLDRFPWKARAA